MGQQYSHLCKAEGDQNEEPDATIMLDPFDQGSALGETQFGGHRPAT